MFGFLNLHKPQGVTSRDVVNQVQRLVRPDKAGHAGTLDPLATGVLVVGVGSATRLIEYVQQGGKHYRGSFRFGCWSPTDDIESDVTRLDVPPQPSRAELEQAITYFVGTIQQRPPKFSAVKVGGRRAYDLARRGQDVDLAPRPVIIYGLELLDYEYPHFTLDVRCGSGTYVRSLGRDLAERLGTAAVMTALVRTAVGRFELSSAVDAAELTRENIAQHLLPATVALEHLEWIVLSDAELAEIANGRAITRQFKTPMRELVAVDAIYNLAAILVPRGPGQFGPAKNFAVHSN